MVMIYFNTNFYIYSSNGSLITPLKQKSQAV